MTDFIHAITHNSSAQLGRRLLLIKDNYYSGFTMLSDKQCNFYCIASKIRRQKETKKFMRSLSFFLFKPQPISVALQTPQQYLQCFFFSFH